MVAVTDKSLLTIPQLSLTLSLKT